MNQQKLTTIGHRKAFNNQQSPYRIVSSGVACMYAQMLKHPHHFDKKKNTNKDMFAAVKLGGIK